MADHIVIDPNSMVSAARDLKASIEKAVHVENSLGGLDIPSVPAAIAGHVTARVEVIARASQVARVDVALVATDLRKRADKALAADGEHEKSPYPDTGKHSLLDRLEGGVLEAGDYTGADFAGDAYLRIRYGEGSWGHVVGQAGKFGLTGVAFATGAAELAGVGEATAAMLGPTGVNVVRGAGGLLTTVSVGSNGLDLYQGKITLGQFGVRSSLGLLEDFGPGGLARLSPTRAIAGVEVGAPLIMSRVTRYPDGETVGELVAVIPPPKVIMKPLKYPEALGSAVGIAKDLAEEESARKTAEIAAALVSGTAIGLPLSGGLPNWAVMGVADKIPTKVLLKGAAGITLPPGGVKAAVATGAIQAVSATPIGIPAVAAVGLAHQLSRELGK